MTSHTYSFPNQTILLSFSLQWPVSKGQWDIVGRNTSFCLHVNYSMEFTLGTFYYKLHTKFESHHCQCIIILVNSPYCPLDNKTGDVNNANKAKFFRLTNFCLVSVWFKCSTFVEFQAEVLTKLTKVVLQQTNKWPPNKNPPIVYYRFK